MAGHSKWANIRRRKEAQDARKGKVFGKLIKEINVAVRAGGPDPAANAALRIAMQQARAANLPKDTMLKAIKKASEGERDTYKRMDYEGYGPGGVAIYVMATTDNLNRTIANVRHLFNKHGGRLTKKGALDFLLEAKGVFGLKPPQSEAQYEALCMRCIDAGADDITKEADYVYITCPLAAFGALQKALEAQQIPLELAEIQRIPTTYAKPNPTDTQRSLKLIQALEEDEDVQRVFANLAIKDESDE